VEAGLAGIPAFLPAWIPVAVGQPTAEAVSISVDTEEQLAQHLEAVFRQQPIIPPAVRTTLDEVIRDWFHKIDGQSHQRVGQRILHSLQNGDGQVDLKRCRRVVYGRGRAGAPLTSRLASRVREALGISMHWSFRRWRHEVPRVDWGRTEKYYDASQVRTMTAAIEACRGVDSGASLHRVEVQSALERGDYRFGYLQGRSVALFPVP